MKNKTSAVYVSDNPQYDGFKNLEGIVLNDEGEQVNARRSGTCSKTVVFLACIATGLFIAVCLVVGLVVLNPDDSENRLIDAKGTNVPTTFIDTDIIPTSFPTTHPSHAPSRSPTESPTPKPTLSPSETPTPRPTPQPTRKALIQFSEFHEVRETQNGDKTQIVDFPKPLGIVQCSETFLPDDCDDMSFGQYKHGPGFKANDCISYTISTTNAVTCPKCTAIQLCSCSNATCEKLKVRCCPVDTCIDEEFVENGKTSGTNKYYCPSNAIFAGGQILDDQYLVYCKRVYRKL